MIEFITNLMINIFLGFTFLLWIVYFLGVCVHRNLNKMKYPRKEFIKDLLIPFRKWYLAFYNLFKD